MSLLNDALRQAEQRRGESRPTVYSGQAISSPGRGVGRRVALWISLAGLALVAIVGAVWVFQQDKPASIPAVADNPQTQSRADMSLAQVTPPARPEPAPISSRSSAAGVPAQTARRLDNAAQAVSATPGPEVTARTAQPEQVLTRRETVTETEAKSASQRASVADPMPVAQVDSGLRSNPPPKTVPRSAEPDGLTPSAHKTAVEPTSVHETTAVTSATEEPAAAQVKSLRETPMAADRRTEELISDALKNGELATARQALNDLLTRQPAPRSRARLARFLLIDGQPARALTWLPTSATDDDPLLRLLRARALLALGRTEESLATLESRVPPVATHAEYLVTLATLLQQQGRFSDAALRWSELIAYDNDRASWWVGLAIALESGQQPGSARRAYQQALALPDLPPALADYCTERLNTLGTG